MEDETDFTNPLHTRNHIIALLSATPSNIRSGVEKNFNVDLILATRHEFDSNDESQCKVAWAAENAESKLNDPNQDPRWVAETLEVYCNGWYMYEIISGVCLAQIRIEDRLGVNRRGDIAVTRQKFYATLTELLI